MFLNFHTCYSTRYIDESLDITRDIRSSLLDAFVTITHYHSRFSLMIAHRHSTFSSRSFIAFRNIFYDRSSLFEAFVTIVHRRSTYLSRSLIVTREFHSRSLDVISDRSASIEVVKNRLIEARANFRKKILSRFQTKDLLVRSVSTRYESRHSSIFRLRLSIYILQHVSSYSIASILVHSIHTSICSLSTLMLWQREKSFDRNVESWRSQSDLKLKR